MQSAKKSEHLRMRREVARRVKGLMGERRSEIMSWPAPAYLWWYAGHAVLILDYTLCYCIPSNTKNLSMQTDMHFKYYPSFYNFIMNVTYKYNDMVFAKCQNYPYWPGKIIGTFTNSSSCKVLFYG